MGLRSGLLRLSEPRPRRWWTVIVLVFIATQVLNAAEPAKPDEEPGPQVSRDERGNVVISITDETQGDMGIKVEKPTVTNVIPEVKGYGRVLDPAALAQGLNDIAAADAAYKVSSNELSRVQLLQSQGNASPRALQAAEATAIKDQLAAQAVRDKFMVTWGKAFATQQDLPGLLQGLISRQAALVRVDLPAGDAPTNEPVSARLLGVGGRTSEGRFFAKAPNVDPQFQSHGYFFLVKTNDADLEPNQVLVGYMRWPGKAIPGLAIPDQAVVRAEGAGWIYVLKPDGGGFERVQVPLDRPLRNGWFVNRGVSSDNYIVTTGAQQLLSIEQKGKGD